jgi:hypothetical protein
MSASDVNRLREAVGASFAGRCVMRQGMSILKAKT